MTLVECPECGHEVSTKAKMCPGCGNPLGGGVLCWEYRSERTYFGLPLFHLVLGVPWDPTTGRPRVAKGIIAVGPIAVGVAAFGGLAMGVLCFSGLGLGLVTFAGVAIGLLLGVGGVAVGAVAVGGCAIGYYALGGAALGPHPLGGNAQDPQAIEFFKGLLGGWIERLGKPPEP